MVNNWNSAGCIGNSKCYTACGHNLPSPLLPPLCCCPAALMGYSPLCLCLSVCLSVCLSLSSPFLSSVPPPPPLMQFGPSFLQPANLETRTWIFIGHLGDFLTALGLCEKGPGLSLQKPTCYWLARTVSTFRHQLHPNTLCCIYNHGAFPRDAHLTASWPLRPGCTAWTIALRQRQCLSLYVLLPLVEMWLGHLEWGRRQVAWASWRLAAPMAESSATHPDVSTPLSCP
ncbi:uncharacterized protein LOC100609776 [Pan troglodytes]|uniref:uncharacterized protein LOC100609776 n=1 Tax=Pan troglodytes TaxID=9598 RepID=UPI00020E45B6|nr:uncharacterized protein LOC100609776 [Pan troglodytes]